jgi:hypothetical protein
MKFELRAAGFTDHRAKRAGCAIVLECLHPDGRRQHRAIGFRLGQATSQLANLRAARLALLSIRRLPPLGHVTLYVDRYVATMLERRAGGYRSNPSANVAAVASLREAYERCQYSGQLPQVMTVKPTSDLPDCLRLAKETATTQIDSDSGTQLVDTAFGSNHGYAEGHPEGAEGRSEAD